MRPPRWTRVLGRLLCAATLLLAAGEAAARRGGAQVPTLIAFDVCVLPSDACTDRRDVVELIVRGETRETAFTNLSVVTGGRTRGEVLSDLTLRPQRLLGAKELLAKFTSGARLAVRATIRRGSLELFLQSVEPIAAGPARE